MDGIEATRRIREHEQTLQSQERVMIVALTGVAQADVERDAIGSGMDTFLTKPVRLDVLGPMISRRIHEAHLI
jgi:CheY-like chemotaxis protein